MTVSRKKFKTKKEPGNAKPMRPNDFDEFCSVQLYEIDIFFTTISCELSYCHVFCCIIERKKHHTSFIPNGSVHRKHSDVRVWLQSRLAVHSVPLKILGIVLLSWVYGMKSWRSVLEQWNIVVNTIRFTKKLQEFSQRITVQWDSMYSGRETKVKNNRSG